MEYSNVLLEAANIKPMLNVDLCLVPPTDEPSLVLESGISVELRVQVRRKRINIISLRFNSYI